MVMLIYGDGVTEINGKVGGEIYRRDRCGNHKQAWYRGKHPRTPEQKKVRDCFKKLSALWIKVFDIPGGVGSWWLYSLLHPKTNKKGEEYFMTRKQAFVSYNMSRCLAGIYIIMKWVREEI